MNIFNKVSVSLLLLLGGFASMPAQASMWDYEMKGNFNFGILSNVADSRFVGTSDQVFADPEPGFSNAFTLTFKLDDTVVPTHSNNHSSSFSGAISDFALSIDGESVWFRAHDNLFEVGPNTNANQDQWSVFSDFGAEGSSLEHVQVIEETGGNFTVVDDLDLSRLFFFLIDTDASTFTSAPPEMVAVNDLSQFEFNDLELRWDGTDYNYLLQGDITSLSVSAVPLPAAFWLFGSAIFGFAGFSRRKIS